MKSNFEQDRETDARNALVASQTEAFKHFLEAKHPDIRFGIALLKATQEYMQDVFLTASDDDFEYALQSIDLSYTKQRVQTPDEVKTALIDKICGLIASSNGGRDGKHGEFSLNTERAKMVHWSVEALTDRLNEVVRKQQLNAQPIGELKRIVVEARRYTGYPQLAKTVVRPGTVRAVALDAAYLRGLDGWELKKYTRLYGMDQINARLRGE